MSERAAYKACSDTCTSLGGTLVAYEFDDATCDITTCGCSIPRDPNIPGPGDIVPFPWDDPWDDDGDIVVGW